MTPATSFWTRLTGNRRTLSVAALGLGAVLLLAVNLFSSVMLRQWRVDMTQEGLFTLSTGTKNVLSGIKEPLSLKLYFSEKLAAAAPAFRTYGQRVRELLEEYAQRSGGMVRLQVIDPEPFSDAEDRAVQAGLQGVPLDQTSGRAVYFGLVGTNTTDHQEVIPFFTQEREPFLEYDLTKLVYTLTDPRKPVVGIISDMDLTYGTGGMMAAMRGEARPPAFLRQLRQLFDVRILKPDLTAIDSDVTVLLVLRPQKLSEATLYAIDQYLVAGGKGMMFVDPWVESADSSPQAMASAGPAPRTATLDRLFAAWGVEMDATRFVADPVRAIRVAAGGAGANRRTMPYPAWLAMTPDDMAHSDVVVADVASLNLGAAGALKAKDGSGLIFSPLVRSTARAQLLETTLLKGQPEPEALTAALKTGAGESLVLAARLTGVLTSAFTEALPESKPAEAKPAGAGETAKTEPSPPARPHLRQGTQPTSLILVADTDLLEDRFWVQEQNLMGQRVLVPFAANADFVANGIDNLTGSNDLIALRGRAGSSRPFQVVEELRRSAGEQFQAREQALRRQLEQAEKQIAELQGRSRGSTSSLQTVDEQATIERMRAETLRTRKELREVQRTLNRGIEFLATLVKTINIGLMPLLVAGFALALASWRGRRRARSATPRS